MRNILYLIQKEFRQIFRLKANLVIIFVMPFIQLVILGFAITTDVKNISTMYVDMDRSQLSRKIIRTVSSGEFFTIKGSTDQTEAAVKKMDSGKIKLAIVIPQHFENNVLSGETPEIQAIVDGVDGNTAGIALGYLTQIFKQLQRNMTMAIPSAQPRHIIETQTRMLYNPNLDSVYNIVPGIMVMLLTMITVFLASINIVREKEIGTLEQLLVTPIKGRELIVGKIIPFAIMGFVMLNVGMLAAGLIFGIWMKGNLLLLYVISVLFMLSTLGVGIFISTIATNQQQAMFYAWFFSIFAILLSGFFIPIENMPPWVQIVTYLDPLKYFMDVIRGIYLKGSGVSDLVPEIISLSLYGSTMLSLAIIRFHKRMS
ncbi:MAG TPA: ABC transporter permease [Candidatus Margulisbacteria bacterium]|nr:MAG: hypothetical protein A2X42_09595 [Candidatus Margulisbacteria bacterium GWF2_38_17]OGI08528.1 MAG: hypothetical protein A2X41_07380 [Candidatus Margulisbacteria bacterium GWE2_39_32]HCT85598.1 ABC transporter permease [Candidatus Margulisiibacteriota bacterium]